ncbi:MAG: hypothetical protein GY895_16650 [Phycisphaera sp.]|nr:hypothetical protein [Phycisphaera sp.]
MTDPASHAVRLAFAVDADLEEPGLRETVISVAHAIAERTGVDLAGLEVDAEGIELSVRAAPIVAVGLAAELRRTTDRWHFDRRGTHLWITPDEEDRSWTDEA